MYLIDIADSDGWEEDFWEGDSGGMDDGLYLIDIADSDGWEEDFWEGDSGGVDGGHHGAAIYMKQNINKIEKNDSFKKYEYLENFALHSWIYPLISVNCRDFLTPTDAVTENPQN